MSRPILTAITLGVGDVRASTQFYEALGFVRKMRATGDEVSFIDAGGVVLALWSGEKLADDVQIATDAVSPAKGAPAFHNVTLAWNCKTPAEVDAAFAKAKTAGAKLLREPSATDYGGYRGYFADPDGHVWEIVQAPGFGYTADGRLILPD